METTMRIAIIAHNALAAEAIRARLRHASACRVLGYVDARKPCGPVLAGARPDLVLVDDTAQERSVLDRIREARSAVPDAKLVLLTPRLQPAWLAEASSVGIDAAIAKEVNSLTLGTLLREVAAGNVFHAFAPCAAAVDHGAPSAPDLTPRELEILRLVAAGRSNSRIATDLWVAEQTVKFHLSNIYRKLGVANRTEASAFAHVNGLVTPIHQTGADGADPSVRFAA
jgi:DNA-binding NarL/FixJ family response regulator